MKTNVLLTMLITVLFLMPVIVVCQMPDIRLNEKVGEQTSYAPESKGLLYGQLSNPANEAAVASQDFTDYPDYSCQTADDFIVPEGETWLIDEIFISGQYSPDGGPATVAHLFIYLNEPLLNIPDAAIVSIIDFPVTATPDGDLVFDFLLTPAYDPFTLESGHYWISVQPHMPNDPYKQWFWKKQESPTILHELQWRNPNDGFGLSYVEWTPGSVVFEETSDHNLTFGIYGEEIVCPTVYADPDATSCSDAPYPIMDALATNYSWLQWSTDGDGFFDDDGQQNTTYYPGPGDLTNGNVELCLTANPIVPCTTSATDCMNLSFQPPPTVNAGNDATINYIETYSLNATANNYSALLWETGGDGSFNQNNILNPVYTPGGQDILDGEVELTIFAWAISPCTGFEDDYIFLTIVNTPPLVEITSPVDEDEFNYSPILVAGTAFDQEGELDFVEVRVNFGTWQIATGTDNWSIEVEIGACTNEIVARATDIKGLQSPIDFVENIHLNPSVDAGSDNAICYGDVVPLNGSAENYGSLHWHTSNGTGIFLSEDELNAFYFPSPEDKAIGNIEICLTAFGIDVCNDATDCMILTIVPEPTADAGEDASINENESYMLSALAENYTSVMWSRTGDGTFDNPAILSPVYTPGTMDKLNGEAELCLTANPISPCIVSAFDCMTLTIIPTPTVDAGPDDTVCDDGGKRMNGKGGCYQLNGNATNFSYVLWSTNGDGAFDEPYIVDAMYCWGNQDVLNGSVILTLTVYGKSNAKQNSDFMVLTIQRSPTADAGPDGLVCCGDVFTFEEASASDYTSLLWSTTNGTGDFSDATTLTASYSPSELDCMMGNVEICLEAFPISPCTVSDFDCMILTLQENPVADAGTDATIDEDETHALSGSASKNSSVYWTTSGDGDFDPPGTLTPIYTPGSEDILSGNVELCLVALPISPCLIEASDCMALTINAETIVNAGPDDTICVEGGKKAPEGYEFYQLNGEIIGPYISYVWMTPFGSGYFENEMSLTPKYYYSSTDILLGTIEIILLVERKGAKSNYSDSMFLTFQPSPTAYAGADTLLCCDDSYTIADALATNYAALQWFTTNGTGTFDDETLQNPTYSFGPDDCENDSVVLCVSANPIEPCTVAAEDCMTIYLQNPPLAFAGEDASYCCQYYKMDGALAMNYSSLLWTTSGDGYFNNASILNPDYYPGSEDRDFGIIELCLTAYPIFPCEDTVTHCMILNYYPYPQVALGPDTAICGCEPFMLTEALAYAYSQLLWTTSGSGTFSSEFIQNPIYYPSLDDCDSGFVELCLHADGIPPCAMFASDCIIITFYPLPEVNCPNDFSVCITDPPFALSGATPAGGSYSGPGLSGGLFDPLASGAGEHTITYEYTDENGCTGSCTFNITVVNIPIANAGPDKTICCYELSPMIYGQVINNCGQIWSTTGDGIFEDETNPITLYFPGEEDCTNGSVELCITAYPCNPCTIEATDCMTLTLQIGPTAYAGEDASINENESYMLSALAENYTSVMWSSTGDGTFDNPELVSPVYTPGTMDKLNGEAELCLTANPISPCTVEATDCMMLTILTEIIVDAGPDDTVCVGTTKNPTKDDGVYQLHGQVSEPYISLLWTTSGTGYFNNDAILDPTYTFSADDILSGFVFLYLHVTRKGLKSNYSDFMVLTFQESPSAHAGTDATICEEEAYPLTDAYATNYAQLLWVSYGTGSFSDPTLLNPIYYPSTIDEMLGSVELCLNAAPIEPCATGMNNCMILTFQPAPSADAGEDATICEEEAYPLTDANATNYAHLLWVSYGTGTFSDPYSLNPTYYPGMMDVLLGSVELCLNTAPIEPCSVGATDCMTLRIEAKPVAKAGSDGTVCEEDPYQITGASIVGDYSAFIWVSGGDGDFINAFELNPVYEPGDLDIVEGEVKLFLIVAPVSPCVSLVFDAMTLYIQYKPAVHAGEDATISCKPYVLSGAAENISSFAWNSSGNGGFINETSLYPTYTPSPDDCNTGTVEICLTGQPLVPCLIEAVDCITLELIPAPFVDAGPDIRICGCDNVLEITEAVAANFETVYWGTEGSGVFSDNYMLNPSYIPGMEDCINRSVKLYIYVTPLFPNTEIVKDSLTIYFDCVWIKDCENDDGTEPSYSNCPQHNSIWGWWRSPDIWVDNNDDGYQDMIRPGEINQVFVKARKFGSDEVENVHVDLYYKKQRPFFFRFPSGASQIPPGKIISIQNDFDIIQFNWYAPEIPGLIKNYVIGSVLHVPVDDEVSSVFPARDNNIALISIRRLYPRVGQPIPKGNESAIEPTITYFLIGNPYDEPGELILDAQIDTPQDWTIEFFDAAEHVLELPYQVSLTANEEQTIKMIVSPDEDAQHGDEGQVAVMQFEADGYPDSEAITGAITFPIKVDLYPPAAITDLEVMASNGTIELQWTPVSLDVEGNQENTACYNVYWGSSPDFVPGIENRLGRPAVDQNQEKPGFQWYDDDIGKAALYYIVRVEDEAGYESENSNIVSINKFYNLNIVGGWSGISSYFIPDNTLIEDMFNPIINELIILYNNQGDLFWPEQGINSITNWDVYMGYAIKVSNELTLNMGGQPITNKILPLLPGWNIIPVLSDQAYSVEDLFAGKSNLQIVKELAGTGVYWPDYSINTLGNVLPGKAYYARMSAADSIDYAISTKGASTIKPPDLSSLLTPWNQIAQTPSSHIVVFELAEKALQDNDIIGGFTTDGTCAGLTKIMDASLPFAISLNADDSYIPEKVGFNTGELIAFRLFRTATGEEFEIDVSYKQVYDYSGLFVPNGMTVVNDIKLSPTGITNSSIPDLNIYPNPNDGTFTIEGTYDNVDIRIINAFGLEVYHDYVSLPAKVNISTQPKGIYFIRLEAGNRVYFEKMIKN